MTMKKRVRFESEQNNVHHEAPQHHLVDPSTIWLTKNDYQRMKNNDEIVLTFMVNGTAHCSGMCTRGLEKRTPEGTQNKQYDRLYAICEVLSEQERQRVQRITDAHRIAAVYKEATIESRKEAMEYGMLDEHAVFQVIMEGCKKNNKNRSTSKSSPVSSNKTTAKTTTMTTITQRSRSRAHRMQRLFGLQMPR